MLGLKEVIIEIQDIPYHMRLAMPYKGAGQPAFAWSHQTKVLCGVNLSEFKIILVAVIAKCADPDYVHIVLFWGH